MKNLIQYALPAGIAMYLVIGCKTATVTSEQQLTVAPAVKPAVVYVSDFELSAAEIKHQDGVLSGRQGPLGRVGDRLSGNSSDPQARARTLVDLMANSLMKDLTQAGFTATRLRPGQAMPTSGWLLRGVFTEVQEGNRLKRAMVGFGQGQTDIQLVATVEDLAHGAPQPLYEVATDASSGSTPGAAPVMVLNPYSAAARFVMSGNDLEKNIKQTAKQIAERMAKRLNPQGGAEPKPQN